MRSVRNRLAFVMLAACAGVLVAMPLFAGAGSAGATSADAARAGATPAGAPLAESAALAGRSGSDDAALAKGYRFERGGWIYVHLEGTPHEIGYQHGYLLAPEIADGFAAVRTEMTHQTGRDWEFFRRAARQMLWPKIDPEYQAELQGIVDGLQAQKTKLDLDDIVALNAFSELPDYYVPWLNAQTHAQNQPKLANPERCSAFVATGSWTKDHQIVIAHNNWTSYIDGARWKIIFDIVPQQGYRMLMDGFPGVIVSDDDFTINSAGLMVTETTITDFHGWDANGKPEFVRARKAMQYASSIDEYVKIMLDGNNGGYANDWLLGDRKTGEVARFELGLRHTKVWKTRDGYFVGSNFASDPDVLRDETTFNATDPSLSANARHIRWDDLMAANKGKIDTTLAETFLADHYDTYTRTEGPDARTLCGHGESQGAIPNDPQFRPYTDIGAVQGKVADSRMAEAMTFVARIGHPCGQDFDAAAWLSAHPEFSWQAPVLIDMKSGPWTEFRIGEKAPNAPATNAGASGR
ncbi:MAG: C45 family autoproteolytic acyltransferase/hydrolase [Candidatus Acidiferrales bacterium]